MRPGLTENWCWGIPAMLTLALTIYVACRTRNDFAVPEKRHRYIMKIVLGVLVAFWALVLEPIVVEQVMSGFYRRTSPARHSCHDARLGFLLRGGRIGDAPRHGRTVQ